MMASTFCESSWSTVWLAVSVVASPESPLMPTIGLPSTPPAALMSLMARSKPANSGGPRKASEPVCGRIVPIVRVPSPSGALDGYCCGTSALAGAVAFL